MLLPIHWQRVPRASASRSYVLKTPLVVSYLAVVIGNDSSECSKYNLHMVWQWAVTSLRRCMQRRRHRMRFARAIEARQGVPGASLVVAYLAEVVENEPFKCDRLKLQNAQWGRPTHWGRPADAYSPCL